MSVAKAHALLGHTNENAMRATAEHLGWVLSRGYVPYKSCIKSKAKQKNLNKKLDSSKKATVSNK